MHPSVRSFESSSPAKTIHLAYRLGKTLKSGSIVALSGTLGSGKTTFVRGIAKALGVKDTVTSPTFTFLTEYFGSSPLYHLDLYRLGHIDEFETLGADEYIFGEGICVIEWAEKIDPFLPNYCIRVHIVIKSADRRNITITGSDL